MKQVFKKLSIILTVLLVLPLFVTAAINFGVPPVGQVINIQAFISSLVTNFVWPLFFAASVVMFLWAGYLFLSAQGNPEKVKMARLAVLWGIIGLVVGILAFSMVSIVKTVTG